VLLPAGAPALADTPAPPPDSAVAARALLAHYCFGCHGQDGEAEKGVYVLEHERLLARGVVKPGDPAGSRLLEVIREGLMPEDGTEVEPAHLALLEGWIAAGAPAWAESPAPPGQEPITEAQVTAWIARDLAAQSERDRAWLRYLSLAHLAGGGTTTAELETVRIAVSRVLNGLSWHRRISAPRVVDAPGLLLRIDLRDYLWVAETWSLLVAAYPYGGSGVALRADWFVTAATEPAVYHQILGLPTTLEGLERLLGVDAQGGLEREKDVLRAAVRKSGVSQHNRVLERHLSRHGSYWKSYDFSGSTGLEDVFQHPVDMSGAAGGEAIFGLPNGLQAYFLVDRNGRRLDRAPVEIVSNRADPSDPVVQNGRTCMGCHHHGVRPVQDDMRPTLEGVRDPSFERSRFLARALALYPGQTAVDAALVEDRERFVRALEATGGTLPETPKDEPVSAVARRFRADLTLAQAAAELGLAPEQLVRRLTARSDLAEAGFAGLLASGGGVRRDVWEAGFSLTAQALTSAGGPDTEPTRASGAAGLEVKLANDFVSPGARSTHALLQVRAPRAPTRRDLRAHLVLVIDRSGSMRGQKLEDARSAALEMVRLLADDDQLTLVAYGSDAEVLLNTTPLVPDARVMAERQIGGLEAAGATALADGLALAHFEARRGQRDGIASRVVLISDGRPTVGAADLPTLTRMAREASQQGIVTTTLGLGADYHEDLMTAIAIHGGGNYHYAERPEALRPLLATEARQMLSTVARRARILIEPAAGVSVEEVFGYAIRTTGGPLEVPLGDLFSEQSRDMVVRFSLPGGVEGDRLALARLRLVYEDEGFSRASADAFPAVTFTRDRGLLERGRRRVVVARLAEDALGRQVKRAAELAERGQWQAAEGVLRNAEQAARTQAAGLGPAGARLEAESRKAGSLAEDFAAAPAGAPSPDSGEGGASSVQKKAKKEAYDIFTW
jgi:Mg-chelatase subunit ChlD